MPSFDGKAVVKTTFTELFYVSTNDNVIVLGSDAPSQIVSLSKQESDIYTNILKIDDEKVGSSHQVYVDSRLLEIDTPLEEFSIPTNVYHSTVKVNSAYLGPEISYKKRKFYIPFEPISRNIYNQNPTNFFGQNFFAESTEVVDYRKEEFEDLDVPVNRNAFTNVVIKPVIGNLLISPKSVWSYDRQIFEFENSFKSYSVDVYYLKEPDIKDEDEKLEDIYITIQKGVFFQLEMALDNIVKISDIPDGLEYVGRFVKGTPTKAGQFVMKVHLPEDQILRYHFSIPNLRRLL